MFGKKCRRIDKCWQIAKICSKLVGTKKAFTYLAFLANFVSPFYFNFQKGLRNISSFSVISELIFLAHLSRRLIGELIVYPCSGVRPSSVVCPSVVCPSSTISKIFFFETAGPIVLILHIHYLQVGGKNNCVFCFDRIRTLVAMATYASHRLIMEKSENCQFLLSCWRYLNFLFAEMFIE